MLKHTGMPSLAKNCPITSPFTGVSPTKRRVVARCVRNRRLGDATYRRAFVPLSDSPAARSLPRRRRTAGDGHQWGLRVLGNRVVGILLGSLTSRVACDKSVTCGNPPRTS